MVVFNYYIVMIVVVVYLCVVFNDTATTEIYTYGHTLSLHDALPISVAALGREIRRVLEPGAEGGCQRSRAVHVHDARQSVRLARSEEHTSELQSLMRISYAVFCLKKKQYTTIRNYIYNQHMSRNTLVVNII